ncbi:single-stranded-DNA-specific exonuclease RecJ [Marinicella sp. S1101]|uniref:single-stranded-DNA-specific exonuclease RecJ n=1 Tax=Marinicella marina TaxID=2996016 RepID=UPI002260C3DF|nr:single-stranded-DNA-specific exonuclease RecJ [Marinicella marina]MCX7554675.1 single-stranded-DNA-specific exonuclease RecJ [Marinicella marina]MDJ1140740.1 single-stranded-DNA-specific exonuclease RecJ [Marinicella marina]
MTQAKVVRRTVPQNKLLGGEHLHHLIQRIYLARGIVDFSEVDYRLKNLQAPHGFKGIDAAAELIYSAIKQQQRIVIVGDFDADGATSTALVMRALRLMGAQYVDFVVPNRFEFGYGLTVELVEVLAQQQAELVITVDNGISSFYGVSQAKSLGMNVIITDHHLPPEQLPPADAIVNPNCAGDEFPSKSLAGVGVAFYLMTAVKATLLADNWFEQRQLKPPNLVQFLDLVALGTVADLVPLDKNNRILVDAGLQRIKQQRCCLGINALFAVAGVQQPSADADALAFYVAPRLNAAGRLEDMSIGINLLLTDDAKEAKGLAHELQAINQQRKTIQADMQRFADSVVDELKQQDELPEAICLYHENWHQGVVGLLASKVKEYTHRPVIAFAKESATSKWVKGSARSIKGLHIRDVLVDIDANHPGLIKKFGGHAMAAGLTLACENLNTFKNLFTAMVNQHLDESSLEQTIYSDGAVDVDDLRLRTAELIQAAGPWGQRFDQPVFDDWFIIKKKQLVGDNHTKLTLQTTNLEKQIAAIAFNKHPNDFSQEGKNIHVCYQMMVNEFRNRRSLQLKIDHVIQ